MQSTQQVNSHVSFMPAKREQVSTRIIFLLPVLLPRPGQPLFLMSNLTQGQMMPPLACYYYVSVEEHLLLCQ